MIYFKVNKILLSENDKHINLLHKERLLHSKAIYKTVKKCLENELKNYPEIDIYLSFKEVKCKVGSFKKGIHKEFKRKNETPYIVLYIIPIMKYQKNIKTLKQVLLHEYCHYRQWLLNEPLKHNNLLPCCLDEKRLDKDINIFKKVLQRS